MTLTNRLIFVLLIFSILSGSSISVRKSYETLKDGTSLTHATPHINNLIRNGVEYLSENEKKDLGEIGLEIKNNMVTLMNPALYKTHDTEHFRFFYTLQDNDAVEDEEYVLNMGMIFEQVWSFHIDSMGFDHPPLNSSGLYEVRIENLPSFYFGYAVAMGNGASCQSYIKMRNSYSSSQFSEHSEEENIQVTAVHEFFHAIQFDYNCYALDQSLWFLEATAVWSEDELYDNVNDLYRYMPSWFSNPGRPIFESSGIHMYGSFILFQYIDEHFGGRETIRMCWESSRDQASSTTDVTYDAIDNALEPYGASFEDAYLRMRIANRILSNDPGAEPYTYAEAKDYKTIVGSWGDTFGPPETSLIFQKGNTQTIQDQDLDMYESKYYSVTTNDPVSIEAIEQEGQIQLSSIIKLQDKSEWTVRTGNELNIDPEIDIEWISLIVSPIGLQNTNWDWALRISDGHSEDFTSFSPYPNPSYGKEISIDLQVITSQTISTKIFDVLGREIWSTDQEYTSPSMETIKWRGLNNKGNRVSNGIYFIFVEGLDHTNTHKIIYLKKE